MSPSLSMCAPAFKTITDYSQSGTRSRELVVTASPHFSPVVCCNGGYIRPDCVALGRPPRRIVKIRLRRPRSRALSERRLRRFATTTGEKSGLGEAEFMRQSFDRFRRRLIESSIGLWEWFLDLAAREPL